jgi:hypothetical protein
VFVALVTLVNSEVFVALVTLVNSEVFVALVTLVNSKDFVSLVTLVNSEVFVALVTLVNSEAFVASETDATLETADTVEVFTGVVVTPSDAIHELTSVKRRTPTSINFLNIYFTFRISYSLLI